MFKIIWDKPHNGVTLTMSSAGEALAIAPRPVFWEELDLLGLNHMGWTYPHADAPLLWACDRRYFYCGVLVMEVKGGNLYDDPEIVLTPEGKNIILTPINIEALRDANADTMFLIEHEAMEFINSVYRRYKGITKASETNPDIDFQALAARLEKKTGEKQVVVKEDCDSFDIMPESEANAQGKGAVLASKIDMFIASFSGGKDSQVLLDLVSRVVPSTDFSVIYSNTGYELPTSLELYKITEDYYKKIYPELKFLTSENHQSIMYYWDKMGSPSRMHRWCCAVMKTAPLYRLLKEEAGLGKQPSVLVFEGVRAEESERRSQYNRTGKGVKHNNVINARPIFEWNATEIYLYILLHDLPYNDAYRKGLARVGCSICPFSSEWSEHVVMKKYPECIQGFVDELYAKTAEIGITNDATKRQYIKEGKWKLRAGGKTSNTEGSSVHFITTQPDFQAVVKHPKEDILKWLVPVGAISIISRTDTDIVGSLKYEKDTFQFTIKYDSDNFTITFSNVPNDPIFHSLLKRAIYKATYCVHCEVCEVECPTGALSVVPIVTVNKKKCVHCHKCLTFKDRGCVMANSINISESINKNNTKMATSGIDRYSTFGMREKWVNEFFSGYEDFFQGGNQLGTKMVPACINWFRECEILDQKDKVITPFGLACAPIYPDNQTLIWELLWVNLAYNSQIVNFYTANVPFNRAFSKPEILAMLKETFPDIAEATLGNPLGALCNMFGIGEETIVGDTLQQGLIKAKGRSVETVMRAPYNDVSYKTVAYSLFRYAESKNRRSLTVSEFYAEGQDEGVYKQFGLDRPVFERILRTLQEERNHVLNVQLNLGLDNINLREDISSADIIKMML